MSKDLTDALRRLTEQPDASVNAMPAPRGMAPAVKSAALLPGASASSGGNGLTINGTKTLSSSDGLFAIIFPDTVKTTVSGAELTIPCIKKVTP